MNINWAKEIQSLNGPFPEVGIEPPDIEKISKSRPELEDSGEFSKLVTEIYFFIDKETGKTYTMQKHWLAEYGTVSLRDALLHIKARQP